MGKPVINCHAHIFTGDHVPPWLAKSFVPWPFYFLLRLSWFVRFFRWWYKSPGRIPYRAWFKRLREYYATFQTLFNRLGVFRTIIEYYISLHALFFLYDFIRPVFPPDKSDLSALMLEFRNWFDRYSLLSLLSADLIKVLIVCITIVFLPSGRNLILFIARQLWSVLRKLPGKQTREIFLRYLNIGRYAFHKQQTTILSRLKGQYPKNTGFVILPMDMVYMKAGKPKIRYRDQMAALDTLKNRKNNKNLFFPFVFVDPRRIAEGAKEERLQAGEKVFFAYRVEEGQVILEDCFIKDFIEKKGFSGFKIYPALGYYPFDELLLPLWKYAADNNIPILTHCVRGPMFYRGRKKEDWNHHPFFEQAMGKDVQQTATAEDAEDDNDKAETIYEPLILPQLNNEAFTANFTHPLNFLCLLKEELLCKVVAQAKDIRIKSLFGYEPGNDGKPATIKHNLHHLKLCLGHYGGGDEWNRYLEKDRYGYSNQLTKSPVGIRFLEKVDGTPSKGKIEQLWNYTDWYSIISSMILQHPNVYADISYILHDDAAILPLLKQTLLNPGLRSKVLYGTDFYVVRNHKSDKNMLADMMGGLDVQDFDVIARDNPRRFLNLPERD